MTHEAGYRGESDEWYTPPEIFTALGLQFDLDPCAPFDLADSHVPALRHLSIEDDGLRERWSGRVWLNPPYGPQVERWVRALRYHGNGIALVPARTDTAWFHREVKHADAVCFVRGRIRFLRPGGEVGRSPGFPSVLIAYGDTCAAAVRTCGLGLVTTPKAAVCPFCLNPWNEHSDTEQRSCEADLRAIEQREAMDESRQLYG